MELQLELRKVYIYLKLLVVLLLFIGLRALLRGRLYCTSSLLRTRYTLTKAISWLYQKKNKSEI